MVKLYSAAPDLSEEKAEKLGETEKEIYNFLKSKGDFVREDLIFKNLSLDSSAVSLDRLVKKEVLISRADAVKNLSDLTAKMVRALPEENFEKNLSKKQLEIYDLLTDLGAASVKEICYFRTN